MQEQQPAAAIVAFQYTIQDWCNENLKVVSLAPLAMIFCCLAQEWHGGAQAARYWNSV